MSFHSSKGFYPCLRKVYWIWLRRTIGSSAFAGMTVLLGSCNFAPDYLQPDVKMEAPAYKELDGWKVAEPADNVDRGKWWEMYNDPQLNELEEKVTAANQNLKLALAQYDEAHAAASAVWAAYFPSVTGNVGYGRQLTSSTAVTSNAGVLFNAFSTGVALNYELDVWGRVRNLVAAGEAREKASAGDLANVDLSLHAEMASAYFTLKGYDAAQVVLDEAVAAYQKALDLTQRRHKGGAADAADVDQAIVQLDTAKTQSADTHLKRAQLEHAIAVLSGQVPTGFSLAAMPSSIAVTPPAINPGLPSSLLERRPDIAAAERRVVAANADIGVARAAYFPTFSLTGGAGFLSSESSRFLTSPSSFWSLGSSAAVSLFDAGRISALSDEARAAYDASVASYKQTVLSAYQGVEDNIVALRQLETESESQNSATRAAKRNLQHAKERYVGGIVTYLEVVIAQNSALQAELNSYDIQTRRMVASVQLVKAMGGGFNMHAKVETPAGK